MFWYGTDRVWIVLTSFSLSSGYPLPFSPIVKDSSPLTKTTIRNMSSTLSQFSFLHVMSWRKAGRVLCWLCLSQWEKKRGGCYIPEAHRFWASPFYLSPCDLSLCLLCRHTLDLPSLVVTRISKLSSHFLFVMPSSPSIMLSEPCFCWLCHVSIILLMYYILFLLAKWIYKICPMCTIAYSYIFLVESSRQFLYQVLLEYLLCARPFMIWALALCLVSSHFLLQWF